MTKVSGPFVVKSTPLEVDSVTSEVGAMRMKFEKTFSGALDATSLVSMMGMMDMDSKSGAYVALEKITGTLEGKIGSFCLQHSSSMDKGEGKQLISVVPGSGKDELKGLSGTMEIEIKNGNHFYNFHYTL